MWGLHAVTLSLILLCGSKGAQVTAGENSTRAKILPHIQEPRLCRTDESNEQNQKVGGGLVCNWCVYMRGKVLELLAKGG